MQGGERAMSLLGCVLCLQPEFQKPLTLRDLPGPSLPPFPLSCRKRYGRRPKAHKVHVDQNKH